MNHHENRTAGLGPGRYFERLSKALPGKGWSRGVREFWPDGAKLVISLSLQFEAGGTAETGSSRNPFTPGEPNPCDTPSWHSYGFKEGIPRLLDVFHRRRIRVTAHMTGAAVDSNPQLAREIVDQGHEAAVRGQHWSSASPVAADEERKPVEATVESIRRAAGTRAVGFHSWRLEGMPNTWEVLQDLGFLYSSDDVSRDEPFLVTVRAKPFVIVPYTLGMNDLVAYQTRHFSSDQYASELRNEFEMLYTESESRRRMMSISIHDRISGRPARAKVLEEFIIYAQRRPGVVFMRKDEIARFALSSSVTPREEVMKKGREAA